MPIKQFNVDNEIVFTAMVKINLADGTVVNIPPGTTGVITNVEREDPPLYTIKCNPETIYFEPSFVVSADEEEFLNKVALVRDDVDIPHISEQEIYDDDMPGYMRTSNEYIIKDDSADPYLADDYLLFRRKPWTDWEIEVRFYTASNNIDEVTGVFRTTWHDGKECEQFTLLPKGYDYAYVQVQILSASRVRCYAHVPAEIEVNTRKKLITIYLLCRVEFTDRGMTVYELPD